MKKLIIVTTAMAFALTAGLANACPKGTHLEGGTGPKHKGGKCVAAAPAAPAPMAMKMESKPTAMKMSAKPMAMKMATKS
jgi:hypothetical protein